jgi:uncharacterized protein
MKKCLFFLVLIATNTFASKHYIKMSPQAPCNEGLPPIEKMICKTPDLDSADENLNGTYRKIVDLTTEQGKNFHQDPLYQDQKNWLKIRNQCKDVSCLAKSYQERLAILNKHLEDLEDENVKNYFLAMGNLEKVPSGTRAILPLNKDELKNFVALLKQNKDVTILSGEYSKEAADNAIEKAGENPVYQYDENWNGKGALWNAKDYNSAPITLYRGDFSNEGATEYALVGGGQMSDVNFYKLVNNRLVLATAYEEAKNKHIQFPQGDGYDLYGFKPFAFIKEDKTYLRYGDYPIGHINYDKSLLKVCTYLWDGKTSNITLVGPNLKVAPDGKLIPVTDCYPSH